VRKEVQRVRGGRDIDLCVTVIDFGIYLLFWSSAGRKLQGQDHLDKSPNSNSFYIKVKTYMRPARQADRGVWWSVNILPTAAVNMITSDLARLNRVSKNR